jgi:hypothetical protein
VLHSGGAVIDRDTRGNIPTLLLLQPYPVTPEDKLHSKSSVAPKCLELVPYNFENSYPLYYLIVRVTTQDANVLSRVKTSINIWNKT